nr:putative ribonuclease H-like domain-containing protein [Tanacetum cinerariifolium]
MQEELLQLKTQQKKGIYYDEVFTPVARIEAIRIFLAFASYMGFIVYQMDVKSAFLYGKINEEVYVSQPSGFIEPKFPKKTASTPSETKKPFFKDAEAADVDVHIYRSMIGSLMYLIASITDIMKKVSTVRTKLNTARSKLNTANKSLYNMVAYLDKIEGNA